MARQKQRQQGSTGLFRVKEGFGVPGPEGFVVPYPANTLVRGDDPIVESHGHLLEPADNGVVEAATAVPGERRNLRLPSGRTLADVTAHHEGHAHKTTAAATQSGDSTVAPFRDSSIGPDDPRHPASTFAPAQPAAGVVAPDVPDEQNLGGGTRPEDVGEDQVRSYVEQQNAGGPGTVEEPAAPPVDEGGDPVDLEQDTEVSDEERQAGNVIDQGGEESAKKATPRKAAKKSTNSGTDNK